LPGAAVLSFQNESKLFALRNELLDADVLLAIQDGQCDKAADCILSRAHSQFLTFKPMQASVDGAIWSSH
jgi:hypothetical protein